MKKRKNIHLFFCVVLLINLILPAYAATGVPEEVITATDSVVFITLATDLETYSDTDATYVKENYSEYVFKNQGSEYVIDSFGSGFVIKNENGEVLIATNNHVVEADHEGIFVWTTEKQTAHAEVVFSIPEKDLSVIRLNGSINKKPVTMSEVDAGRGEAVYVVGFPGAGNVLSDSLARTSDEATITDGIISAVRSFTVVDGGDSAKILQINAAVNSGNSGGPLFNTEGKVIGINTYGVEGGTQGVFGAVAVSELWTLLERYEIDIPEETTGIDLDENEQQIVEEAYSISPVIVIVLLVVIASIFLLTLKRKIVCKSKEDENAKAGDERSEQTDERVSETGAISITKRKNTRLKTAEKYVVDESTTQQSDTSSQSGWISLSQKGRDNTRESASSELSEKNETVKNGTLIQPEITLTKNKHKRE